MIAAAGMPTPSPILSARDSSVPDRDSESELELGLMLGEVDCSAVVDPVLEVGSSVAVDAALAVDSSVDNDKAPVAVVLVDVAAVVLLDVIAVVVVV